MLVGQPERRQSAPADLMPVCRAGHDEGWDPGKKAEAAPGGHARGRSRTGRAGRQLTRTTSTRLSENVGARPRPDHSSEEMQLTEPSERLSERQ